MPLLFLFLCDFQNREHTPDNVRLRDGLFRYDLSQHFSGSIAEFVGAESGGRRRSEEKSKSRTFPPRLEIPQVQRDSHFFHRPCCDEPYFDFPVQEEIADSRPDGLVCCLRRQ